MNVLMAARVQWAVDHGQEDAWVVDNCGVVDDRAGGVMEGLDDQIAEIKPCFVE